MESSSHTIKLSCVIDTVSDFRASMPFQGELYHSINTTTLAIGRIFKTDTLQSFRHSRTTAASLLRLVWLPTWFSVNAYQEHFSVLGKLFLMVRNFRNLRAEVCSMPSECSPILAKLDLKDLEPEHTREITNRFCKPIGRSSFVRLHIVDETSFFP